MPKFLGASVYRLAALKGIATFKARPARIVMNGRATAGKHREDETLSEVIQRRRLLDARGRERPVLRRRDARRAPRATPGDGLFDVQISHGPKGESVKAMQKMFKGEHLPSPFIKEFLATSVTVDGDDKILIEADGEVVGTTPATFDIVPDAIPMKV